MSLAKFVYKQQSNLLPSIFENHYTRVEQTHDHETRQMNLIKVENATNITKHSELMSKITGAKVFNALPEEIRDAHRLYKFKDMCKTYYISKYETVSPLSQ